MFVCRRMFVTACKMYSNSVYEFGILVWGLYYFVRRRWGRLVILLFVLSIFALPLLCVCAVICDDFAFTCVYLCLFTASVKLLPPCIFCLTSRSYSLWGLCPVFLKWLVFNCYLPATAIWRIKTNCNIIKNDRQEASVNYFYTRS